jgi:starch-binding outer membrane protein, SusD/RagB family
MRRAHGWTATAAKTRSAARVLACAAIIGVSFTGCKGILDVSNPGSLQEGQLSDPALEQFEVNGAIGEFQYAFGYYSLYSAILGDELFTDHTNVGIRELSLHNFNDLNDVNQSVFEVLSRARASGDDAATRIKTMLGAGAGTSLNVARALTYGGYSYVLLGEGFCEAPIALSAGLPPAELFKRAVAHFDSAITIASAAAAASSANAAAAQDLINMARVGAARASLKGGDLAKARAYAALVPATYEKLAYYSSNSVRENNIVNSASRTTGAWISMTPAFQGLSDPRVPQPTTSRAGLNSNPIWVPLRPSQYSGWLATNPTQTIDITSNMRIASGLEAQYIVVEADGANAAMLTFVNARRAVGGKPPVNVTGAALVTEFRQQRAIDFYLTGQRLGDLRRYAAGGTNLFPTGKYPVFPDPYGSAQCFAVPRSEKTGNPNYRN